MTKTKLLVLFTIIGAITSVSAYSAYAVGGFTETTQNVGQIVGHGQWFSSFNTGPIGLANIGLANVDVAYPIEIANDTNVSAIGMSFSNTTPTAICRAGIYGDDGTGYPGSLIADSGNFTKSPFFQKNTISSSLTSNTIYWLAVNCNVAQNLKTITAPVVFGSNLIVGSDPAAKIGGVTASHTFGDGSNALPSVFPAQTGKSSIVPFIALQRQ